MKNTLANRMAVAFDITRVRLRRNPAGTSGAGAVRSRTTNITPESAPAARGAHTCGDPQGWAPAAMNPYTIATRAPVPNTAPRTSAVCPLDPADRLKRSRVVARLSATSRDTATSAITATGTFT